MVDVPVSHYVIPAKQTLVGRQSRTNGRAFWLLFVLEAGLLVALISGLLALVTPAKAPLAAAPDRALVREAVLARLNGTTLDPLIMLQSGTVARESSLRGFALGGVTYFYYLEGQPGYDPLSRGSVSADQVQIVLRDERGPQPLVIYTLRD